MPTDSAIPDFIKHYITTPSGIPLPGPNPGKRLVRWIPTKNALSLGQLKKYYANYKDQDDLISIGTIGLIKAVSTFDCCKGTRFATYAARCIENEILMYFRSQKKSAQDVYISDPIDTDKDGNALTLMDIVADEENIFDMIDLKLKSEKLYRLIIENLNERERLIIKLRYGLCGCKPLTQREVADRLKISRSYVSKRA